MAGATGVYPCYENQFQIDKAAAEGPASYVNIADCETFGVAFDNNIEEWTPFDTQGWVRRLMTGKGVTITVTAKRNVGDEGNDLVAGLTFENGKKGGKEFPVDVPRRSQSRVPESGYQCNKCRSRRFHCSSAFRI